MIVCKFGGKATTTQQSLTNILKLKEQNDDRVIFVFSAIGKLNDKDIKLTDLLIEYDKRYKKGKNADLIYDKIIQKFNFLQNLTKTKFDIINEIKKSFIKYKKIKDKNFLISRGEYFTAKIMSHFLNIKFIPAEKCIFFNKNLLNYKKIQKKLKFYLKKYKKIVIPGFYCLTDNKKIKLFSRGGGDVTGAIIAKALNFSVYENWTDVVGVKEINPNLYKNAKQIEQMSYLDMFLMSCYDAKVIHKDCSKLLKCSNTLLKLKSIYDIYASPTYISSKNVKNCSFVVYKKRKDDYLVLVKCNNCLPIIKKFKDKIFFQKKQILKLILKPKCFKKNIIDLYEKLLIEKKSQMC